MIGKIKRSIREYLTKEYDALYEKELQEKALTYDTWIGEQEKEDVLEKEEAFATGDFSKKGAEKAGLFSYDVLKKPEVFLKKIKESGLEKEYVILAEDAKKVGQKAVEEIVLAFETKIGVEVIYTDEDEYNHEETARMNPWLKPDYSPQTLLSYFYFGNLVAVRRAILEQALMELENRGTPVKASELSYRKALYALILEICSRLQRKQVFHIQKVLYSSHYVKYWGFEEEFKEIRQYYDKLRERENINGVSMIIPSKDNPEILERCLKSVTYWTKEMVYEIWVVDNGSSEENREKIKELKVKYKFNYLYKPMEFNFSRMCNLGAGQANYDMLLFLNDDCEVRGSKWLVHMAEIAAVRSIGAVGAKLYYPDSKRLQHCGIYNLHLGPVHKLQFKEDARVYYDRRNRDVRNVLAVTAACLMIRKETFLQMQGFDESLQVAFNDVDLCFRLYEAGYDNVIDNEIHLWHHESLSRGSDESKEKWERLMSEKQKLYEKHKELWEKDPYYHPWFTTEILDTGYSFLYEYPKKREMELVSPVKLLKLPEKTRIENCVVPMVEYAGNLQGWFLNEESLKKIKERLKAKKVSYIQGNVVVLGTDNACYEKNIVLRHEITGDLFEVIPEWYYRPDIFANLTDQKNVELSGFGCLLDLDKLPEGRYELGFLVMDRISKQYLLRIATRSIENGRNKL